MSENQYEGLAVEETARKIMDAAYESSLKKQIAGNHYNKLPIQPVQYIMKNKLDYLQGAVVKYVTRFRDKGGVEDLMKAKHCIDMLIEFEHERTSSV